MKRTKKFLISLFALASISAFALGVAACGDDGMDTGTLPLKEENTIEQVYDTYVEYATKKGQTPLDYETWLNTIKGADGVGIKSVQVDEDGMMIITLTDGTVLPAIELPTGEPIEKGATRNLHYQKIAGKDEYCVIGLGLASESDIVISSTYNGLPVTEIGDNAFEEETYITSIEIPDTVTAIGDSAFSGCSSLTSVTIPDSVTTIGDYAFYNCESLTSLTIGNSLMTIGYKAFYGTPYNEQNSYIITIQYEDGTAYANKRMGLCDYSTGFCANPKTTDENGKVVFEIEENLWAINNNFIPNGYELQEEYTFTEYGEYTVFLVEGD